MHSSSLQLKGLCIASENCDQATREDLRMIFTFSDRRDASGLRLTNKSEKVCTLEDTASLKDTLQIDAFFSSPAAIVITQHEKT